MTMLDFAGYPLNCLASHGGQQTRLEPLCTGRFSCFHDDRLTRAFPLPLRAHELSWKACSQGLVLEGFRFGTNVWNDSAGKWDFSDGFRMRNLAVPLLDGGRWTLPSGINFKDEHAIVDIEITNHSAATVYLQSLTLWCVAL